VNCTILILDMFQCHAAVYVSLLDICVSIPVRAVIVFQIKQMLLVCPKGVWTCRIAWTMDLRHAQGL